MRWRVNSKEYGYPLSKKGILRGYIKYGIGAYLAWHYTKVLLTPSAHHGHHGHHEHHGHGDHGHHATQAGAHHDHGHKEEKHH